VSTQIELEALTSLEHYIKSELNLRVLHVQTADRDDTKLEATADARVLGKRLGGKFKATAAAIKALDSESVRDLRERGELDVAGELILLREVHVARRFTGRTGAGLEAASIEDMSGALLLLDVKVDEACLLEAAARDLTSRLQKLKKRAGVAPSDVLTTWFQVPVRFAFLSWSCAAIVCRHVPWCGMRSRL
jgi:isoleucyl-tRNA synthetase